MSLMRLALTFTGSLPVVSVLLLGYQLFRNGQGIMGKPTLTPWLFFLTKLTVAVLFAILMAACISPGFFLKIPWLMQTEIPDVQQLMALIFLLAGNLFLIPALYTLSIFTRAGLPTSAHVLRTDGIYRISRNPMYVSFCFFFIACFLLVPSLLPALLIIFCLITHHFIIVNEERFLGKTFGDQYRSYKRRVAKYI